MFLFYTIILIYTCRQEHKTNVSELLVFNFSFLSFKSCPFFFFYRPEVRQLKCFLMLEKKKKILGETIQMVLHMKLHAFEFFFGNFPFLTYVSTQRKPKISASRKLMLKVRRILPNFFLPNDLVIHVFDQRRAAEVML